MTQVQAEEEIADKMLLCNTAHRQLMGYRKKYGPDSVFAKNHEVLIKLINKRIVTLADKL